MLLFLFFFFLFSDVVILDVETEMFYDVVIPQECREGFVNYTKSASFCVLPQWGIRGENGSFGSC